MYNTAIIAVVSGTAVALTVYYLVERFWPQRGVKIDLTAYEQKEEAQTEEESARH